MENSKVIISKKTERPKPSGLVFTPKEKKRLTDFFALLIEIDRRENVTKFYDKPIK